MSSFSWGCALRQRGPTRGRSFRRRLFLTALESKCVPAAYVVDNLSDIDDSNYGTGQLSLREAVNQSNASATVLDAISFNLPANSSITLTSEFTISDSVVINGSGKNNLTINGNNTGRLFNVTGGSLSIASITLKGGSATGTGGAINFGESTVTVTDCLVTGNTASTHGGAFYMSNNKGELDIVGSDISGNSAGGTGGVFSNQHTTGAPVVRITSSLLSGNKSDSHGGALYFRFDGNCTIVNSTVTGNTASGTGGGLYFYELHVSNYTIKNSTITGNSATSGGGIYANSYVSDINLDHTIIAGNIATTAAKNDFSQAVAVTGSYNLIGDANGSTFAGTKNQLGTTVSPIDPMLDILANNGGKTRTQALKPGSPALNVGGSAALAYDQRGPGYPRVVNGALDIGAFEGVTSNPQAKLTSAPAVGSAQSGQSTYQFTVVYTDNAQILTSTIANSNVTVSGPSFGPVNASSFTINNSTAASATVTYTIGVPGGTWDTGDSGVYTVRMVANQVSDNGDSGTTLFVAAGAIGTFSVGATYLVDVNTDVDDGITTAGNLSLREAIRLTNTSVGAPDTINFAGSVTGTLTMTGTEYAITDAVTINGPGSGKLTITAGGVRRIFNESASGDVFISGLTLAGGSTSGTGGAIITTTGNLTLNDMIISKNSGASSGGGVAVITGNLTVTNSRISSNTTSGGHGGGIYLRTDTHLRLNRSTVSGNQSVSNGGGIYFYSGGSLYMDSSTISGNISNTVYTGATDPGGGGVYWYGAPSADSTGFSGVTIVNSTISNNTATGSPGGGISVISTPATVMISNSTIAGNVASTGGGIAKVYSTSIIQFTSTIVAGNTATTGGPDVNFSTAGKLDGNNNLIGVGNTGSFTLTGSNNITGTSGTPLDAKLNPLGNYGGPTQTRTLQAGSTAIGAGDPGTLNYDQRGPGFPRGNDIGAVAYIPNPPTVSSVVFGDGTNERSMVKRIVVTFSQPMNFMGGVASAFTVHRTGTNGTVGDVTLAATPGSGLASAVTITFSGSLSQSGGSLVDGLYNLIIGAAQVTNANGVALDGNNDGIAGGDYVVNGTTANKFYRLFGDTNGDGTADQTDYLVFRNALAGGPSMVFDFDASGDVDQTDYLAFRERIGAGP
ncbi:MAG: beta strand repeat-containing protein [Gemmataceae bacterium]